MKIYVRLFSTYDGELTADVRLPNAYLFDVGVIGEPGTTNFSFNLINDPERAMPGELSRFAYGTCVGNFRSFEHLREAVIALVDRIEGRDYNDCMNQLRRVFAWEYD